jgi:hypothetical protein
VQGAEALPRLPYARLGAFKAISEKSTGKQRKVRFATCHDECADVLFVLLVRFNETKREIQNG